MTKLVGGQAVIEGVMMRNEDNIAIAVRDPKKEIQIKRLKLHIPKIKIPIVRGIINLVYMMYIGIKSLNYSSSIALEEESKKVLKALSTPTKQCEKLASCVKNGIAFHHPVTASG